MIQITPNKVLRDGISLNKKEQKVIVKNSLRHIGL